MEKTKLRRYQWIRSEHPLVSEIIKTFPHLASSRWVSIMYIYFQKMHHQKFSGTSGVQINRFIGRRLCFTDGWLDTDKGKDCGIIKN